MLSDILCQTRRNNPKRTALTCALTWVTLGIKRRHAQDLCSVALTPELSRGGEWRPGQSLSRSLDPRGLSRPSSRSSFGCRNCRTLLRHHHSGFRARRDTCTWRAHHRGGIRSGNSKPGCAFDFLRAFQSSPAGPRASHNRLISSASLLVAAGLHNRSAATQGAKKPQYLTFRPR